MDALADPRQYLSERAKEEAKRAEQLNKIGIDETDIDTSNVILGKGKYLIIAILRVGVVKIKLIHIRYLIKI